MCVMYEYTLTGLFLICSLSHLFLQHQEITMGAELDDTTIHLV